MKNYTITGFSDKAVKEICFGCWSKVAKDSYNYIKRMNVVTKGRVWEKTICKVLHIQVDQEGVNVTIPGAFYYASVCREHIRLIEIAVRSDFQGKGLGRVMLYDLLEYAKRKGKHRMTFRTPMREKAPEFWLHMGANIIGTKGNDFEMEINIK